MNQEIRQFTTSDLTINDVSKRLTYRRRKDEEKKSIHWGQRKLLLSEIEFFVMYWDSTKIPNPLCVYAGAGPGTHIPVLSVLFPSFTFHLYDPRDFNIKPTDRIKIFKEYFTDEIASNYSDRSDVFFISDIRTANYLEIENEKYMKYGVDRLTADKNTIDKIYKEAQITNEDQIWGDMNMQQNWVLIMNPEHALLKFRLPYALDGKDKIVQYLKGVVYWQVWPPQTSTETRLKPIRTSEGIYEVENWSILEYEQWCFYHNVIEREKISYLNPFTDTLDPVDYPELLNDYDSVGEAYILKLYYESIGSTDIYVDVINLSRYITDYINHEKFSKNTLSSLRTSTIKSANKGTFEKMDPSTTFKHSKIVINPSWRHLPTVRQI